MPLPPNRLGFSSNPLPLQDTAMTNDDSGAPASGRAPIENCPSTSEAVTVLVLIAAMFTVIGVLLGWLLWKPLGKYIRGEDIRPQDATK